jgi:isochorismate hydrolase
MSSRQLCEPGRSQLLIIDIQERLFSAMPEKAAQKVLRNSKILVEACKQLSIPVVRTEQYPKGLGATHRELQDTLPDNHHAFEKTCFSSCGASGIEEVITDPERDQVILIGMEAHVCVLQTAFELQDMGKQVFLVNDAVCSRFKDNYKNAIERMRQAGIIISNTESVLFEWLRDASHPQFKAISRLIR